jgi:hypothetical protein
MLDQILMFGGIEAVDATVTDASEWRMDFEIVLSGATTFDIGWLTVNFNPSQSY